MSQHKQTSHTHRLFSRWCISHLSAMQFAVREWIRSPFSNLITICVIGIALALPLGFYIVLKNLQYVGTMWDTNTPTISLYLNSDISSTEANNIIDTLHKNKAIASISYISPEQGLKTFKENTGFGNAVKLFQKNPIPGVIVVTPIMPKHHPEEIQALYQTLKHLPQVDSAQLDMDWVTRLFDIILIGKQFSKALSALFGFTVILVIGHTLRSSLSTHAKEVQVLKLIGATNAYIRRPLLYRGILYGLAGGLIALLLVSLFLSQVQPPISELVKTYHTIFQLQTISLSIGLIVLLISSGLGLISAWMITMQFLNQPENIE